MSIEQAVNFYEKVMNRYRSGMYTQEDIANELNVSNEIVAYCTQYAGYFHTKAKQGEKGVYYDGDPFFLELKALLEK